jgi:hypothetical protein
VLKTVKDIPSLCRIRIIDDQGKVIACDDVTLVAERNVGWLPLEKKGHYEIFHDSLYHKESVAKVHPIFEDLGSGIMDMEYYGPIISHQFFKTQETPDDVVVAAFATGYPCEGGYASGLMMAVYPFATGKFLINTLNILENIDVHPAADQLMLNLIRYADKFIHFPLNTVPENISEMLETIGYDR